MKSQTIRCTIFVLYLFFVPALSEAQTTTYYYEGNNYIDFVAPYSADSHLTGSFQLATPLEPNATTDLVASLQKFSFSDGQATRDQSNSTLCEFSVTTDAFGKIISWHILLREIDPGPAGFQHSLETRNLVDQSGFAFTMGSTGCADMELSPFGESFLEAGNWLGGPVRPVPTLSSEVLIIISIIIGFWSMFNIKRRRA